MMAPRGWCSRRIRHFLNSGWLALIGTLCAATASSGVPDPTNSSCPDWIFIVGTVDGSTRPDPMGFGTIVVRDAAINPISGYEVMVDFTDCCDIRLCGAVVNGQMVECANGTVEGITDAQGRLEVTVFGAAIPNTSGGGLNAVKILARADCCAARPRSAWIKMARPELPAPVARMGPTSAFSRTWREASPWADPTEVAEI
jgi:hypothetical protein